MGRLLAGSLVASLLPGRLDEAVVERLMRLHPSTQPRKLAELSNVMREALSTRRECDWDALARSYARTYVENYWGRYRGIGYQGWQPRIEFSGAPAVRDALKAGRGGVFWCMRFSSDVVLKQGFSQAGLPLVHLSHAAHGAWQRTAIATTLVSPL